MDETLCKFQNSGYCKYKENCKFKHVKEKCEGKCERKTCQKRHQKFCKFGSRCRRPNTCEFKHEVTLDELGLKADIKNLETTIKELVEENKKIKTKMVDLETELKASQQRFKKENEEKDTIIKVLRNKLEKEEYISAETKRKLKIKEQENVLKEKEIGRLKEKSDKKEAAVKKYISSIERFRCDKCNFSGEDENDVEIHKEVKHDVRIWLQCDRCKFNTADNALFKRHMEYFIHRPK